MRRRLPRHRRACLRPKNGWRVVINGVEQWPIYARPKVLTYVRARCDGKVISAMDSSGNPVELRRVG